MSSLIGSMDIIHNAHLNCHDGRHDFIAVLSGNSTFYFFIWKKIHKKEDIGSNESRKKA